MESCKNEHAFKKEVDGFFPVCSKEAGMVISPRLYAPLKEKICLQFLPLKPVECDPKWEDWHCYRSVLRLYWEDCQKLLMPYFDRLFPLDDPITGKSQDHFDPCFDNWIGEQAWRQWLAFIKEDLPQKTPQEQEVYQEILEWVEQVLKHTGVIVVEGNL